MTCHRAVQSVSLRMSVIGLLVSLLSIITCVPSLAAITRVTTPDAASSDFPAVAVSANGRYVVFQTAAPVIAGTNGKKQIYRKDLVTGTIALVSCTSAGAFAGSDCTNPSVSNDGQYIAFQTYAVLDSLDTHPNADIYVRNMANPAPQLVSVRDSDDKASSSMVGANANARISADGQRVVFTSTCTDLIGSSNANDQNGKMDVFVRDLGTGHTSRVSVATGGAEANADCQVPNISSDGRYVVFASAATTLATGTSGTNSVFLRDLATNTTTCLDAATAIAAGETPAISDGAAYIAFTASDGEVHVYEAATQTFLPTFTGKRPSFSADGRFVGYQTGSDLLLYNRVTNARAVFAAGAILDPLNFYGYPTLDREGRFIAFQSVASNLWGTTGDTAGTQDIFLADMANFKPDLLIRLEAETDSIGNGTYNTDGKNQTKSATITTPEAAAYIVTVQNDDPSYVDHIKLTASATPAGWTVSYYDVTGSADITEQAMTGGWAMPALDGGASRDIRVTVKGSKACRTATNWTLSLTATSLDQSGKTDVVKAQTTWKNSAPVATEQTDVTLDEDNSKDITLAATDADDDTLIYAVATQPQHGKLALNGTTATYTPDKDYNGPDSFTFTANDGLVTSAAATVSLTVKPVNDLPVIAEGSSAAVTCDEDNQPTAFALTLNASDVDGDTLTWEIGTPAGHGTATASGTGASMAIGYTPADNYNGPDSFAVKVSDGQGGEATITVNVTVNPINDVPVIAEGASTAVTCDENNDPTPFALTLHVSDVDGDTPTWSILTQAEHGTATADGSETSVALGYTPTPHYFGTDSFVVKVIDGKGGEATITVNVTLNKVNHPPVISLNKSDFLVNAGGTVQGQASATDEDSTTFVFAVAQQPTNGTVTIDDTGAFSYTAFAGASGTDTFSVTASHAGVASQPAVATVQVVSLSMTMAPQAPGHVGTPTLITTQVNGGGTWEYQCSVQYHNTDGSWSDPQYLGGDAASGYYSANTTYPWTPSASRTYTLITRARQVADPTGLQLLAASEYNVLPAGLDGVTLTASQAGPNQTGVALTLTAATQGLYAGPLQYKFFAQCQLPGGGFTDPQYLSGDAASDYYTDQASITWTPQLANTYTFIVYVRVPGSSDPFQVFAATTYKVLPAGLDGVTLTATQAGGVNQTGIPMTLTATPQGTYAGPMEYKFFAQHRVAGGGWTDPQYLSGDAASNYYSDQATLTWTPQEAYTYTFIVYARAAGSPEPFQVYNYTTHQVVPAGLEGVTVTASQAGAPEIGTPITLQAAPQGSYAGALEYKFFAQHRVAGGGWSEPQYLSGDAASNYFTNQATITWTPQEAYTYTFIVYARAAGSPEPFHVYNYTNCLVLPVGLTGVKLAASQQDGVDQTGVPLTLTATPQGTYAGPMQYRFFTQYQNSDGSWSAPLNVSGDAASDYYIDQATCTWTPQEARTYVFIVYARAAGCPDAFQVNNYTVHKVIPAGLNGVTVTATPTGTNQTGNPVTLQAAPVGTCTLPLEYKFFAQHLLATGGWSEPIYLSGDASTNYYSDQATISWTPQDAYTYTIVVYVRGKGSAEALDTYGATSYTALPNGLDGMTLTLNPVVPAMGQAATLTATTVGTYQGALEYQFFAVPQLEDGSWGTPEYLSGDATTGFFSPSATSTWTPSLLRPYLVAVFGRQPGCPDPYQVIGYVNVTISETALIVTANMPEPLTVNGGQTITFTANVDAAWAISEGEAGGTLSVANGFATTYTAPMTGTDQTVHLVVTTAGKDPVTKTILVKGNTAPTLSAVNPVEMEVDGTVPTVAFTIGDGETAADNLTVSATSSDETVLPTANLAVQGTGADRTLAITPVAGKAGTTTITLTVSDGTLSTTGTFTFTVLPHLTVSGDTTTTPGGTAKFTASEADVVWSVDGTDSGTITDGNYVAPTALGTYTIRVTKGQRTGTATIQVAWPAFSIADKPIRVEIGSTLALTTAGAAGQEVTWSDGGAGGSFAPATGTSTVYTPPSAPALVTITATTADGRSDSAAVNVKNPGGPELAALGDPTLVEANSLIDITAEGNYDWWKSTNNNINQDHMHMAGGTCGWSMFNQNGNGGGAPNGILWTWTNGTGNNNTIPPTNYGMTTKSGRTGMGLRAVMGANTDWHLVNIYVGGYAGATGTLTCFLLDNTSYNAGNGGTVTLPTSGYLGSTTAVAFPAMPFPEAAGNTERVLKYTYAFRGNGGANDTLYIDWRKPEPSGKEIRIYAVTISTWNPSPLTITKPAEDPAYILTDSVTPFEASEPGAKWSILEGDAGGVIEPTTGLYGAPSVPGQYTIKASKDVRSATRKINVVAPLYITKPVEPVYLLTGATAAFEASEGGVAWSVSAGGGTIDAVTGAYTAPTTAGDYTVTAGKDVRQASVTVHVVETMPLVITHPLPPAYTYPGNTFPLVANETGGTWTVVTENGGTVNQATGEYTAPATPGTYTVRYDCNGRSATVDIIVVAPLTIPTPTDALSYMAPNGTITLQANESGVTWSVPVGQGSITADGVFTAPAKLGQVTITAKKDIRVATKVITVAPAISVVPATTAVSVNGMADFTITPSNSYDRVVWSVEEPNGGTIDPVYGVYTAPAQAGTYHVVATTDNRTAKATITVSDGVAVPVYVQDRGLTPNPVDLTAPGYTDWVSWATSNSGGGTSIHRAKMTDSLFSDEQISAEPTGGNINSYNNGGGGDYFNIKDTLGTGAGRFEYKSGNGTGYTYVTRSWPTTDQVLDIYACVYKASGYVSISDGTNTWTAPTPVQSSGGSTSRWYSLYIKGNTSGATLTVKFQEENYSSNDNVGFQALALRPTVQITGPAEPTNVAPNGTLTFTTNVTNATWKVIGTDAGTIASDGTYTAPATPGTYYVKCTQGGVSVYRKVQVVNPPASGM